MRRPIVRSTGLIFPIGILASLGVLAALGWNGSIVVQHTREAVAPAAEEHRLLDQLAVSLQDTEIAQHAAATQPTPGNLALYQRAAARLRMADQRLVFTAQSDPVLGRRLSALGGLVERRELRLAREIALASVEPGLASSQAESRADEALSDQILQLDRTLQARRASTRSRVSGGLRMQRWLAAGVALLGIVGILGVLRQLARAWRRLSRAENEQRQVALQLRGTLDSLSQGVAVFSQEGRLLNWNLQLCRILAVPESLLRSGVSYQALERHLAARGGGFLEPLSEILADAAVILPVAGLPASGGHGDMTGRALSSATVYEGTVRHDTSRSDLRPGTGPTQIEIRRTLMPEGGFVLTLTDISARVQSEQILREAQKMQALGQLTGGIAHDFNNMLMVILGSLEVSPDELDEAHFGVLGGSGAMDRRVALLTTRMQQAAKAAESGAALTRQLLSFARKQPLTPVPVDLAGVLSSLMPLLRHMIDDNIAVSLDAEAGLWPAMVDAAQLESAVLNLLVNARDAMKRGGRIRIEACNISLRDADKFPQAELPPGDYVHLAVSDEGHGMSPEVVERAFEPFFTTKPEGQGTGLGLAMVFAFARQCGGIATIHSEPGRGTRLSLYLPRSAPPQDIDPGAADLSASIFRPPLILVVEDDDTVRSIAADALREQGYKVREAADADDALRLLDAQQDGLDLLLTDLTLPGSLDGRALAAEVRKNAPATPVLYISGALEDPVLFDTDFGHATRWLSKPFRRAELTETVGEMVGRPEAGRAA